MHDGDVALFGPDTERMLGEIIRLCDEDKLSDVEGMKMYYIGADGNVYCVRGEQFVDCFFNTMNELAPTHGKVAIETGCAMAEIRIHIWNLEMCIKRLGYPMSPADAKLYLNTRSTGLLRDVCVAAHQAGIVVPEPLAAFTIVLGDTGERFGLSARPDRCLLAVVHPTTARGGVVLRPSQDFIVHDAKLTKSCACRRLRRLRDVARAIQARADGEPRGGAPPRQRHRPPVGTASCGIRHARALLGALFVHSKRFGNGAAPDRR